MALNPVLKYPTRTTGVTANYPYGSSKNESSPGAGDGTPYELARADDIFGFQQALLNLASIVPTNNAETALASQYLQAIIELAQGRAINYDDSGAADAYVLDVQTNQQAPASLFDGQIFEFIAANTNTGASTVNPVGLGVKNIVNTGVAGTIAAGVRIKIRYRLGTTDFEIVNEANPIFTESFVSAEQVITAAGGLIIAHGLTTRPSLLQLSLINKSVDLNYAIGDQIVISNHGNDVGNTGGKGVSVWPDATNLNITFGSDAGTFALINKTTGIPGTITNTNWRLILRAWK